MSDPLDNDRRRYRSLLRAAIDAYDAGDLELSLEYASVAASLARHGIIRWYDDDLESLLASIGSRCIRTEELNDEVADESLDRPATDENSNFDDSDTDRVQITYLATYLADNGGHSETLRMWTKLLDSTDTIVEQRVMLTNQHNDHTHSPAIESELVGRGVSIHQLDPTAAYTERIQNLATLLAEQSPDRLVLFINPDDVVAVSALCGLKSTPYTVFFNHADHVFWLGRRVIDDLIEYRSVGRNISNRFRNLQSRCVIPLTTDIEVPEHSSPLLDLDAETVSASIGSQYKVQPKFGYNYFRTVSRLLERNPNHAHVLITTRSCDHLIDEYVSTAVRDRFHLRGPLADLRPVYHMADILLDTIPFSGGMTRLEALACGIPMVVFELPQLPFLPNADVFTDEYPYLSSSEDEYVLQAEKLLSDRTARYHSREWMHKRFTEHFSPDVVSERLATLLIVGEPPSEWIGRPMENSSIDHEAYARHFRSPTRAHKRLLMCAIKKESPRGVRSRLHLYLGALREHELESAEEWVGYFGLSLLGRRAYPIARTLRDTVQRLVPD